MTRVGLSTLLLQKSKQQNLDIRVDVETKAIELTVEKLGKELAKEVKSVIFNSSMLMVGMPHQYAPTFTCLKSKIL
jgi:hypothetical protein